MDIDKEIGKIKYHEDLELGSCKILKNISDEFKSMRDRIAQLRAFKAEIENQEPAAYLYKGEPQFDGKHWSSPLSATTDYKLAVFKSYGDEPIPLFASPISVQQPVCEVVQLNQDRYLSLTCVGALKPKVGDKLYASPMPAQQSPAVAVPDTDDSVSSIGNELHNYATSLYYCGNEDIADNLEEIAIRLWKYKPDTRITIQDARDIAKIKSDAVRDFCREIGLFNPIYDDQEYIEVSRYKLRDHCDELLNKLNAKQEK